MSSRNYFHATEALLRELGINTDSHDGARISEGWNRMEAPVDVARTVAVRHGVSGDCFAKRLGRALAAKELAPLARLAIILSATTPNNGGS